MIINTFHGATDLGYAQGVDFNCNATICYGIGDERHKQFQLLQQLLNLYIAPAQLVVDGFLGDGTVKAANFVARGLLTEIGSPFTSVAKIAAGVTKQQLATLADDFILALNVALAAWQAKAPPTRVAQYPATSTAPTPTTPSASPSAPVTASGKITATVTSPARPAVSTPTVMPSTVAPTTWTPPPPKRSTTPYLIAGGVLGVVLIGSLGYAVARRKQVA